MTLADIQKQRHVADIARHHVADTGTEPAFIFARAAGGAVTGGFEADYAAIGGRDTDRAAAVGGMGHRHNACGDR